MINVIKKIPCTVLVVWFLCGFVYASSPDFNYDTEVNVEDLILLSGHWLGSTSEYDIAPTLGDGIVDLLDFVSLADNWLKKFPKTLYCGSPDFNHDTEVNLEDLILLSGQWLGSTGEYDIVPLPGDGIVNIGELAILAKFWQNDHDLCSEASPVQMGCYYFGSTKFATGNNQTNCSVDDYYDAWHQFTSIATQQITVSLVGSQFDTSLSVYNTCGSSSIACNDDYSNQIFQSQLSFNAVAGRTYLIRVAGAFEDCGPYMLTLWPTQSPPPHDTCENSWTAYKDYSYPGSTQYATASGLPGCGTNDIYDVWYKYHSVAAETVEIVVSAGFEPTVAVYKTCSDQAVTCKKGNDLGQTHLTLPLNAAAGQDYMIRVAGDNLSRGSYILRVIPTPLPPVNDEPAGAISVIVNSFYQGSTLNATGSVPVCSQNYPDTIDVWYKFAPVSTGSYSIELCGSTFDTTLAVYNRNTMELLGCNDDSLLCGYQSNMTIGLTANIPYLIRIAGYGQQVGDYILIIRN